MTVGDVLRRGSTAVAICGVMSCVYAGHASAQPEPEPVAVDAVAAVPAEAVPPPPPPPEGLVGSTPPAITESPDGWKLELSAKDETQVVIAPLTTAVSSREYEVGGIFNGKLTGPEEDEPPHGTLEVGYEIGCGIDMSTSNGVTLTGSLGLTPGLALSGAGTIPTVLSPISGGMAIALKPGLINVVPVSKKEFTGFDPWIMVDGFRVKIDGCVGESFIRSYAYLTRSTDVSDAIVAWYGVTKKV
jgi:MspA